MYRFLPLLLAFVVSSCVINQDLHINSDQSGTNKVEIDMSSLMAMMPEEEGGGSILDSLYIDSTKAELEKADGITNVRLEETENGKVTIAYDFRNLEVLNASLEGANLVEFTGGSTGEGAESPRVEIKGKKVTYIRPEIEFPEETGNELQGMDEMIEFNFRMSFDREIKKVKNDRARILKDGKAMEIKANLREIMDKEVDFNTQVKLR